LIKPRYLAEMLLPSLLRYVTFCHDLGLFMLSSMEISFFCHGNCLEKKYAGDCKKGFVKAASSILVYIVNSNRPLSRHKCRN
jgi:hypothetical protein